VNEYDVEFRDQCGDTFATANLAADNDEQAIARARLLLSCGIGDCCEIRRDSELVCVERLDRRAHKPAAPPRAQWTLVHKCIEQALDTVNLQQRRLMMLMAEKFLECPQDRNRSLPIYQVRLIGAADATLVEIELHAEDDFEAFSMASILADACTDKCARFELRRGMVLKSVAVRPFLGQSPSKLQERSQHEVVAREVALHDSRKSIAESQILLNKVDRWLRTGVRGT